MKPRAKEVLNSTLAAAGIDLSAIRWCAIGDSDTLWELKQAKVYVPLGGRALNWLTSTNKFPSLNINLWRGSTMPVAALRRFEPEAPEDYLPLLEARTHPALQDEAVIVPTLDPAVVAIDWTQHPYLIMDLKRAHERRFATTRRTWFRNNPAALAALADKLPHPETHSGIIAIDTEQQPFYIVGIATDEEVHVFQWRNEPDYRESLQRILESPFVIKVAQNLAHDWTFFKKSLGLDVAQPWFDTMGGAHVLNVALDKNLSPAIATRYTNWPYHKWLDGEDPLTYNGLDCIVAYDAYEGELAELMKRPHLYEVARYDHAMLAPLLDMQWHGVRVDTQYHAEELFRLNQEREAVVADLQTAVQPVIDARLKRFKKPHLFEVQRSCGCCGGGKVSAQHCWRCGGLRAKPQVKDDYFPTYCYDAFDEALGYYNECDPKQTVAQLREALPQCKVCGGTGKVTKRLPFNPDSSDQVADILYRGLGIPARRYKGVETVRVGQIEPLKDKHPIVAKLVDYARTNAEYETVKRLQPDSQGLIHSVFNPWGTVSGRVASSEGLIEKGTNLMNLPKQSRRLIIPDEGYLFLYPDKAAIEARAIAVLSGDTQLIEMFNDGVDMHVLVRDDMRKLGPKFEDFSRDQAKRLEYATFYGGRAPQVAKELSDEALRKGAGMQLTPELTQLAMDTLLSGRFHSIQKWHDATAEEVLRTRKLRNITGREFVWLDYIYDPKTKGVKYEILKQIWSRGPQDVGGWVLGHGLLALWQDHWEKYRGLIHVHDALVMQVRAEDVEEAKHEVTKLLSNEMFGMKFPAEMKVGRNWYEAS